MTDKCGESGHCFTVHDQAPGRVAIFGAAGCASDTYEAFAKLREDMKAGLYDHIGLATGGVVDVSRRALDIGEGPPGGPKADAVIIDDPSWQDQANLSYEVAKAANEVIAGFSGGHDPNDFPAIGHAVAAAVLAVFASATLRPADPSSVAVEPRSHAVEGTQHQTPPGPSPEAVAKLFHETYERLAPSFGYKTREASAVPWEQVPDNNRALMTAVAAEMISHL